MNRSTNIHCRACVLITSGAAGLFFATTAAAQPAATQPPPMQPPAAQPPAAQPPALLGALNATPQPQPPGAPSATPQLPVPQPAALGAPIAAPPPLPPGAALPPGPAYPYAPPAIGGVVAPPPGTPAPVVAPDWGASNAAKSTGPYTLPYYEGEPAPPGYRLVKRTSTSMAVAGGSTLGGLWLISILTGAGLEDGSGNDGEFLPLMLPFVGPFITLGTADPNVTGGTALVLDGLGQCVAGGLFITGLVTKHPLWVRDTLAVNVTPFFGGSASGVAFEGRF